MSDNTKSTAIAVGAALAGSLALTGSAFAMHSLAQGYMVTGHEALIAHEHDKTDVMKEGEKPHSMAGMDTDKDGMLSKAEFAAAHDGSDAKFAAHDPDGDGFISAAEMEAHHAADAGKKKGMEGKCGEGKCGEGKCGGSI
ncbi:MAG: hypothetical protein ABIO38_08050 [Luteimonas sp.]